MSKPHGFKLDLTNKLSLKDPGKNMALANLTIYYTWKNIKSEYNNNKFIASFSLFSKLQKSQNVLGNGWLFYVVGDILLKVLKKENILFIC